jgi:diacylglycerol kinase (ATP)
LARAAAAEGMQAVFALGGDGTVRETAAGLLGSEVPLGILPGGTVNVLARALGLPRDAVTAARRSGALVPRALDVGLAGSQPFLMMVSAGLDSHLLSHLDLRLKRWLGQAGIGLQGLSDWWRYPYPPLQLEADGVLHQASFAAVSNIPLYGGTFRLAPAALPDDGKLDLVLFRGSGRRATLRFVLALARGAHVGRQDVTVLQVREVTIRGPEGTPFQVDGDAAAERCPVTIRLAEERLHVLVPVAAG